jgi:hypothetical protein
MGHTASLGKFHGPHIFSNVHVQFVSQCIRRNLSEQLLGAKKKFKSNKTKI